MKIIAICLQILLIISLLVSITWMIVQPGYEPLLGIVASLSTLIGDKISTNSEGKSSMSQKGGKNSRNYQSSGNMTINNER